MANVLILSMEGDGIPLAIRLVKEGHLVDVYLKDPSLKDSLKGYKNPKTLSTPPSGDTYDLIISDMVGLGELCEKYKKEGRLVLGGGVFNDKIELDRLYGSKVLTSLTQAKESNTTKAKTKTELLEVLKNSTKAQVLKPLNNKNVSLTLVSNDSDNISLISTVKKWGDKIVPCIIQQKVEGFEISTEGWFNGERFVIPFNHTFERKRLFENDKGPQTGCMGNVVFTSKGDKLTKLLLLPLEPLLKKVNYIGPIDINCIISNKQVYFLEVTSRIGYDAIQAFAELLKISLYDFFYKIATKQGDFQAGKDYLNQPSIAVRLSVPPYPSKEDVEKWKGIRVLKVDEGAAKHVWLSDVMKEDNIEVLAGTDGVIGCVTARGLTIRECQRRVYRTIKNIVINQDIQYREDIGDQAMSDKESFDRWCEDAHDTK
jgi:phosphoribosylamine--glycine ligase